VLALGNSHTRQTFHALLCQHSSAIVSYRPFLMERASSYRIKFENGASLVLCTNSPLVYSADWPELIAKYDPDHQPLEAYDAVVLGKFNAHRGRSREGSAASNVTSRFDAAMLEDERRHPNETRFTTVPPPTLRDVHRRFNVGGGGGPTKPIVAVSMFAGYGRGWEESCRRDAERLREEARARHQRRELPILVLSGRAHVEAMGAECGTDGPDAAGECWNDDGEARRRSPYGRPPRDMHRCAGPGGGHADLVAWDVGEALHDLLLPQSLAGGGGATAEDAEQE
jgi:hypothetical protein